jgi:hypothetical protein
MTVKAQNTNEQCQWRYPNGETEREFLCCIFVSGHEGSHKTAYADYQPKDQSMWYAGGNDE